MSRISINQLRRLPVLDRIELVDELIESIGLDQREVPVTAAQRAMIDQRLQEISRDARSGTSLAAFRKEVRGVSRSLSARPKRKSA